MIIIPYSALSIRQTGNFFVLDASEEKLASAPVVDEKEDSIDQAKAEEIYRYFGQSSLLDRGILMDARKWQSPSRKMLRLL